MIVVLGYQGEPYLRVGPHGVDENRHSPTVDRNRSTAGASTIPASPTPTQSSPPDWHRISHGQAVRWNDRRTRWEGPQPDAVRLAPAERN